MYEKSGGTFFFPLWHSAKIGQKAKHWTHCHSWRHHSKYGEFRHVSWKYGDLRGHWTHRH
jgi:hypothetical protein